MALSAVTGARESELMGPHGIRVKDIDVYDDHVDYRRVVLKKGSRDYSFTEQISKSTNSKICAVYIIKSYMSFLRKDKSIDDDTKIFLRATRSGEIYKKKGLHK